MNESGHTPGPWTIDHARIGPSGEPVALLCDTNAPESGTVVEWPRMPEETIDEAEFEYLDEENEANARLIASAPEMLETLENAYAELKPLLESESTVHDLEPWQTWDVVRETIAEIKHITAKARGGK